MRRFILPALILLVILVIAILLYRSKDLKRAYKRQVSNKLQAMKVRENDVLTEDDIKHLPRAVQEYIIYTGALGKEKVHNMRVVTEGDFKTDREKDWTKTKTYQYSFFAEPTRIYYLELKLFRLPVIGLHSYSDARASMLIKLGGLVTVADGKGKEMNQGETVTVFNDMCLLAPASLIDDRITWEVIDDKTVKAYFSNKDYTISAQLSFNKDGQLVNFSSDDRFYSPLGETYEKARWSTPVDEYREINGMRLPAYAKAVWHFPEGDYCYARLNIVEVEYNCTELK